MSSRVHKTHCNESGFSLIEIMIGLVIGMLGMLVIMQVSTIFESQKRTVTGSGDAQNGGAIALYSVQRDIQQAGEGISTLGLIGCNVLLRAGVTISAMAPVTINHSSIPAGDANTDTLLVVYKGSNSPPEGNLITSQAASTYAVQASTAFAVGDLVIAEPATRPSPCNLSIANVTSVSNPNITVSTVTAGMTGGTLYTLGSAPIVRAYAVRNGNLTVCDYMVNNCGLAANAGNSTIWAPIANNLVSLRAQYGRDTSAAPMSGIVNAYDQTTPTTACGWIRVSTVRMIMVARNGQLNKTDVTNSAPNWSGAAANNPTGFTSTALPVNLTSTTVPTGFTWKNYRYKGFETTVPIQNVQFQGVQTGC
jgi:type IV pilus assembly protein PilW